MNQSLPTVFIIWPGSILTQCCIRSLLHHPGCNQICPSEGRVMHVELKHWQDCLCSCFKCCWMCVCRLQPIFEVAAKKFNNSINRIQFLNTTAVVTVTMWHIRQQCGCVSSLMKESVSSRDPKKIRMGRTAQWDSGSLLGNVSDGLTSIPRLWHGCNLQNARSGGDTDVKERSELWAGLLVSVMQL